MAIEAEENLHGSIQQEFKIIAELWVSISISFDSNQ